MQLKVKLKVNLKLSSKHNTLCLGDNMKILVFNCGSSSIKYQLFEMPGGSVLGKGMVQRIGEGNGEAAQKSNHGEIHIEKKISDHKEGLAMIGQMLTDPGKGPLKSLSEISACGHRVVHGGEAVSGSVVITPEIKKIISEYSDLAPLHNPPNLTGIEEAESFMPRVPQIAVFDTAFHQSIPRRAFHYAVPYDLYEKFKVRRYGFHGTSHKYVAERAAEILNKKEPNLITCHLGNGCSIACVKDGKSIDTSMGLTPLEGLVMGTRSGDFDPAIIFYLERKGYKTNELDSLFNKKSGLLGVSGLSNDLRDLEEKAAGNERAALALEIFAYRVKKYIGAYLAVLNGCDAVIFTGGIGENGTVMRKRILTGLDTCGIIFDEARNKISGKETPLHKDNSPIKAFIIPTNEELAIARDTYNLAGEK